jgi:hypothetical protein
MALLFKVGLADIHTTNHCEADRRTAEPADIFLPPALDHLFLSAHPGCAEQGKGRRGLQVLHRAPGSSDVGGSAASCRCHEWATLHRRRKALLLGQRAPRCDKSVTLTRSYDPVFDPMLLKAKQAHDYFLLVGPPGTGKTSRALRFLVEEQLAATQPPQAGGILLLSYTNRAVDEICGMLVEAGIDFIRLGNELSCAPQFEPYLIANVMGERPTLGKMRQRLTAAPVIVSTTSMLQSHPFIFALRHFGLAIVDESSQILERASSDCWPATMPAPTQQPRRDATSTSLSSSATTSSCPPWCSRTTSTRP